MTTLPKDKHALVIQGSEEDKKQACIEIRDWAVKNGIPIYIEFKNNPRIGYFAVPVWDYDGEEWMILRVMYTTSLEEYGYTIHHTVDSFMKVFEVEESEANRGYETDLINELINIYEHPEDSNKEWKDAIISRARENGYGYPIELTNPKN